MNCVPTPEMVRDVMAALGRRGGLARSASKAQAAKLNGKKGGRPRKKR
jgi:hypothetical protein